MNLNWIVIFFCRDKRHSQCSDNSQFMYQNSQMELSENSQDVNYSQPLSGEISGSEVNKKYYKSTIPEQDIDFSLNKISFVSK